MGDKMLQFVSLEQAQKLKKLGFDWKTEWRIGVTSVALALKWFRDVKDNRCDVRMHGLYDYEFMLSNRGIIMSSDRRYPVYEEAESALLDRLIAFAESELLDELIKLELKKEDSDVI